MKKKRAKRRSGPASDSPERVPTADDPLARRFLQFADETRAYDGPLYEALSLHIARDPDLLRIARHVRRPPVPNVFFAAVHFLLADTPRHDLAEFYGSLSPHPQPPSEAHHAFREFVLSNSDRLIPLLETRITQTNEVSRCTSLMPSLTHVHRSSDGRPLALIDVGCSAGLHLRWDRYHYNYGIAQAGDPRAAVRLRCELRGDLMPPIPTVFPAYVFRLGIDLNPIDLTDSVERRWFEALIWPDHAHRRELARAAIDDLLRDPPAIVKGDAVHVLGGELERAPADAALVVYNSAALCQGGAVEEHAIAAVLATSSAHRPIYWLHCENEEVLLRVLSGGRSTETKLANKDGHGRWLEWRQSS